MSIKNVDINVIDRILEKMVDVVENSKSEIFAIGEQSRREFETLFEELEQIRQQVILIIDEGDRLEKQARLSRKYLSEVSQHFKTYSEEQILKAYEKAHALQVDLQINRQTEKQLRTKRDDLERRLIGLKATIDRAEKLVSQISIVENYLTSDLAQIGEILQDAKRQQEYGFKIIEAQEEERKRLSREIHDGPAQMMANVMMRSDLIDRIFRERGPDEAIKEIREMKKMVRNALYEVRRIIYDLRPMALDDLGLVPTLRKYLQTIEDYAKTTKIEFINLGKEIRLPSKLEIALFRLIQESVQNTLKHADATLVKVKLELRNDTAIAIIKDDGKGFDQELQQEGSFGIIGMKERVDLLNGSINFDSVIGRGTVVMIHIPYQIDEKQYVIKNLK
ncbi:sensor histidine kinase [Bacillus sp. AGMB 02131]|uniref:Signal transduction histidine-protein kinase/phosphatase DegS n=1 Tax=Peribacillus faecalis TaxID=2772559 RepID=A0A927CXF3_9BACI|nr:sensor histidine kinase [Peribacillus faecalis]MBD3108507.1 sensor histidine kinase [Peribacillus faecalis]